MISFDEDALMCDLAETYQVYDYKQLPPRTVAVFCCGLRENSRIKLAMSQQSVPFETILLADLSDKLSLLVWSKTKDGQKGIRRPPSILKNLVKPQREQLEQVVFSSGEEFTQERNKLLGM